MGDNLISRPPDLCIMELKCTFSQLSLTNSTNVFWLDEYVYYTQFITHIYDIYIHPVVNVIRLLFCSFIQLLCKAGVPEAFIKIHFNVVFVDVSDLYSLTFKFKGTM